MWGGLAAFYGAEEIRRDKFRGELLYRVFFILRDENEIASHETKIYLSILGE